MRTLVCQGPPQHEWQYTQNGRGRPPLRCPEHRQANSTRTPPTRPDQPTQALPLLPDTTSQINPFIQRHEKRRLQARVERMRQAKAEKAEARRQEDERHLEEEFEAIDEREAEAYAKYEQAFRKATARPEDDPKLWHRAAEAQQTAINVSARKRWLQAHFDNVTAPTTQPTLR